MVRLTFRGQVAGPVAAESRGAIANVVGHETPPKWAAYAVTTDPRYSTNTAAIAGRMTFAHRTGDRCRMRRVVTQESRERAYDAALASGRKRISLLDF